jgi:hypothetical protein
MITCTQKTTEGICVKPAVVMMHWPGREALPVCQAHRHKALEIACAMGGLIEFTQIEPDAPIPKEGT